MVSLRRHQLAWLSDAGWAAVLAPSLGCAGTATAWRIGRAHRLPLVVTRQPADAAVTGLDRARLAAPARWGRRRLALQVPRAGAPALRRVPSPCRRCSGLLPRSARRAVRELLAGLRTLPCDGARLRQLWLAGDQRSRPRAAGFRPRPVGRRRRRGACGCGDAGCSSPSPRLRPRLDGELVFGDGAAVAWREWAEWRAGVARAVHGQAPAAAWPCSAMPHGVSAPSWRRWPHEHLCRRCPRR